MKGKETEMEMENNVRIDIIDVNEKNKGLLVIEKDRKVVVMVEKLTDAREVDTMIMMQEIKEAYRKYRSRVLGD